MQEKDSNNLTTSSENPRTELHESTQNGEKDTDWTSSSGSSSEEDLSSEEEVMKRPSIISGSKVESDLKSRLTNFLPRLQAANQQLETSEGNKYRVDEVDDDVEHFVEMNLALGVLTEQQHELDLKTSESSEADSESDQEHVQELQGSVEQSASRKIEEI